MRTSLGHLPDEYVISEFEVFKELSKIKLRKSVGPDTIPHKILKNLAHVLAAPVTAIINVSLRQGIVHEVWKISRCCSAASGLYAEQLSPSRPDLILSHRNGLFQ